MIFRKSGVWDCKKSEPCYRFLSHLGGGSQARQNIPGGCFRSRNRPKGWQGVALESRNESCYPFSFKGCKFTEKSYWYSFVDPASTRASRAFAPFAKLLRNFFHCAKVRLRRRYTPSFAQDDSLFYLSFNLHRGAGRVVVPNCSREPFCCPCTP